VLDGWYLVSSDRCVELRVQDFGCRVSGVGFQVQSFGCRVSDVGLRVSGFGVGFRVQFRV